jgi:hypothetical protein
MGRTTMSSIRPGGGRDLNRLSRGESVPHRLVVSLLVASLALCATTVSPATAGAAPSVVRGHALRIDFTAHSQAACMPQVRYADGTMQNGAVKKARRGGHLSWSLLVPRTAPLGAGTWALRCGVSKVRSGHFVVVAPTDPGAGEAAMPRVVVDKQGFSQRDDKFGTGSHISFGMFLHNTSATEDALDVYVLVNMVAADGELIGSMNHSVTLVAAGQSFGYGDSMGLRTKAPVAKLELTVRVARHEHTHTRALPEFANVRIFHGDQEPDWVSEVDGEVLNTTAGLTLTGTRLSVVLLDAAGNPVGGGTGSTFASLPSGSRMVFVASTGFDSVQFGRAVTPVVSVEPTYVQG